MRSTIKKIVKKEFGGDFVSASKAIGMLHREVEFERSKKMLKENNGKIPRHRWYRGEKFNYTAYGLNKGKITGYFKTEAGRYGGNRRIYTYYKAHESGLLVYINETMCKMGITQGLSTPYKYQKSNKREFDAAMKRFFKAVS